MKRVPLIQPSVAPWDDEGGASDGGASPGMETDLPTGAGRNRRRRRGASARLCALVAACFAALFAYLAFRGAGSGPASTAAPPPAEPPPAVVGASTPPPSAAPETPRAPPQSEDSRASDDAPRIRQIEGILSRYTEIMHVKNPGAR